MKERTKITGAAFSLAWMIFTFLEYWQYHSNQRDAFRYLQYGGLGLVLLTLGAVLIFLLLRYKEHKFTSYLTNGIGISLLGILLAVISMNAFFLETQGNLLSFSETSRLTGRLLTVAASSYLITLIAYSGGRVINQIFNFRLSKGVRPLAHIGSGIILLVSLLFVLGSFKLLKDFLLWPLMGLILALSWRSAVRFLKVTLWRPIPAFKELNVFGLSAFFLLMILIAVNFTQVIRPFPTGFDAMTQYVNISSLIDDYDGLVKGFGAYNWSLLMALGYLLFHKTVIVLSLSFLGGVLSLFALFALSRKWLDSNFSLLVNFLFYSMPMISWLSYRDMKVDMGLLFFSLLIVIVFTEWLAPAKPKKTTSERRKKKKKVVAGRPAQEVMALRTWGSRHMPTFLREHALLVLLGVFTGFAVGIKFSALIILFALLPAIGYARGKYLGFSAALAWVFFVVLAARLDSQAALRSLHLWADQLQWVLLFLALSLTAFILLRRGVLFRQLLSITLLFLFTSGAVLSPWLIKNAIETKSISVSALTNGKSDHPRPIVQDIRKNYETRKQ